MAFREAALTDSIEVLREKLNVAWHFFYHRGYIDGFGHISARTEDPNRVVMTPHELDGHSRPEDFVIVDLDGNQYGSDIKLPGELEIHLGIYRNRPDVGSVAHFHCTHATSFSMSEHALKPSYFIASIFQSGIPIHPDPQLVSTRELGEGLAKTLGPHRAALIRAHGIVVTGADVEEMAAGVYIMEDNAKRTWVAATMGEHETLGEEEAKDLEAKILKHRGPIKRVWRFINETARDLP